MTKLELKQKELKELKREIKDFREGHSGTGWSIKDRMEEKAEKLKSEITELEKQTITDADIEAYFNNHATEVVNNGYSAVRCMRREDVIEFVKAVLNGEIKHIK